MKLEDLAQTAGQAARAKASASAVTADDIVAGVRRRRRRRVAVAGLAVALVAGVAVLQLPLGGTRVELVPAQPGPSPQAELSEEAQAPPQCEPAQQNPVENVPAGWDQLTPPPVRADTFSTVPVPGSGVMVVAGAGGSGSALLDPDTGTWSCRAAAPMKQLSTAAAGASIFAWNGRRAALYDVQRDVWDALPAPPGGQGPPLAAVWAEDRLLVWRRSSRQGAVTGAAWDPAAARWAELAPAPVALNRATAVWDGTRAYLIGSWLGGGNHATTTQALGAVYDPTADAWQELPPTQLSPQASSAAWMDGRLIAWDYLLAARSFDPDNGAWEDLPDLPLADGECYPSSAVIGDRLAAWYCGQLALWDASDQAWLRVEVPQTPPGVIGSAEATENALMIVSGENDNLPAGAWTFDINGFQPPDPLPEPDADAKVRKGVGYRHELYTHCGIEFTRFAGRTWQTEPQSDGASPPEGWGDPMQTGTMTHVYEDVAVFQSDHGETLQFQPTNQQPPPCD